MDAQVELQSCLPALRCCFSGDDVVAWQDEVAQTPTGYESLWYDTLSGSHAAASEEKRQYNSSHTSSEYETLNRSYSPLTANKNTLLPYGCCRTGKALLELLMAAPAKGNSLILSGCQSDFCSSAWRCCLGSHFLLGVSHCCHSELVGLGLSLLHSRLFHSNFSLFQRQGIVVLHSLEEEALWRSSGARLLT